MQTLLTAQPGAMQEVLDAFFSSLPGFEIVGIADDSVMAWNLFQNHHPALIVIDGNLPEDDVLTLVRDIKRQDIPPKTIVFANGTRQEQLFLSTGADAVLHRGIPTTQILEAINRLNPPIESKNVPPVDRGASPTHS